MAQDYRPQLDGQRAIAIGLVGVEHFGGLWVFVLSGFLITRNLMFRLRERPCRRSRPQVLHRPRGALVREAARSRSASRRSSS